MVCDWTTHIATLFTPLSSFLVLLPLKKRIYFQRIGCLVLPGSEEQDNFAAIYCLCMLTTHSGNLLCGCLTLCMVGGLLFEAASFSVVLIGSLIGCKLLPNLV